MVSSNYQHTYLGSIYVLGTGHNTSIGLCEIRISKCFFSPPVTSFFTASPSALSCFVGLLVALRRMFVAFGDEGLLQWREERWWR